MIWNTIMKKLISNQLRFTTQKIIKIFIRLINGIIGAFLGGTIGFFGEF